MKINFRIRVKNPYFWVGIIGTMMTAMGVSPETFDTWQAVLDQLKALVSNPFMLGSVLVTMLAVIYDPTTARFGDSQRVLQYSAPNDDRPNVQYQKKKKSR
jgi:phi LC3 family holin